MARETIRVSSPLLEALRSSARVREEDRQRTNPLSTTTVSSTVTDNDNLSGITPVVDTVLPSFMRAVPIQFTGYNLRPGRRTYVFFDDKNVSSIVERPNIVELDNSSGFNSILTGGEERETVRINGGTATVLHAEKNSSGNTVLYLTHTVSGSNDPRRNPIVPGNSVFSTSTSNVGNVVSYQHFSGVARSGSNSSQIRLSTEASSIDEFYTGNTIALIGTVTPGRTANIISYNGFTRMATVSPSFDIFSVSANVIYSLSDSRVKYSANNFLTHYTTPKGFMPGVLWIPDPNLNTPFRFRTGDRILSLTDSKYNKADTATSYANYVFNSGGLQLTRQQLAIQVREETVNINIPGQVIIEQPEVIINPPPPPPPPPITIDEPELEDDGGRDPDEDFNRTVDPTAQTFYVSEVDYPDGIFVPSITLFFANKGVQPIEVQIRPVVNGYPSSTEILPGAVAVLDSDSVNVSEQPDASDPSTYTEFKFITPVYLRSGREYAFVVLTNDFDYDMYVSELGETIIGSDRVVSEQPYVGSMFKSQNARTYTAIQSEDIMFIINKCIFNTSGSVVFSEKKNPEFTKLYRTQEANTKFDAFDYHSDILEVSRTNVDFSYKAITSSNNTMDISYSTFKPDRTTFLPIRKEIKAPNDTTQSFLVRMNMSTDNPDVSPIIYSDRQGLGTVRTIINDMSLDRTRLIVANTGNGYTYQNTSVSITSNVGEGANATIITMIEPIKTGKIVGLRFDANGQDYFEDATINITSTDGNGASILVQSELNPTGGPAYSRYVSKTVTLTRGSDGGDLRVYLTAVKPPEANIQVYYKVRNFYDNESIDVKRWTRMEQRTGIVNFSEDMNPIELEFRPSLTSNSIVYSTNTATFDTFNQFKVKIVLSSSDTVFTKIPYVYDMIAVALPSDSG